VLQYSKVDITETSVGDYTIKLTLNDGNGTVTNSTQLSAPAFLKLVDP
jgi:hypothetical protein